ncbi:hypothetical protein M9Y10_002536 [Tritrichomonas musculus]|uniref:Uncharacterized protein n=1 Tax=Tritrichomonas musculus TaxID=1915356 RepID=A0ABR2LB07_9EUKA
MAITPKLFKCDYKAGGPRRAQGQAAGRSSSGRIHLTEHNVSISAQLCSCCGGYFEMTTANINGGSHDAITSCVREGGRLREQVRQDPRQVAGQVANIAQYYNIFFKRLILLL